MALLMFLLQVYILRSMRFHEKPVREFLQQRRGQNPFRAFNGAQICRLQQWSLCLLCMLCLLSVRISAVEAEELRLAECDDYYVEIIEIQDQRQKFQDGANMLMKMFELDLVTKKKLDNTLWMWHNIENKLRTQVTSLYDNAYAKGCFDESIRTERGDAP